MSDTRQHQPLKLLKFPAGVLYLKARGASQGLLSQPLQRPTRYCAEHQPRDHHKGADAQS
jgi:hypothetical protein